MQCGGLGDCLSCCLLLFTHMVELQTLLDAPDELSPLSQAFVIHSPVAVNVTGLTATLPHF